MCVMVKMPHNVKICLAFVLLLAKRQTLSDTCIRPLDANEMVNALVCLSATTNDRRLARLPFTIESECARFKMLTIHIYDMI